MPKQIVILCSMDSKGELGGITSFGGASNTTTAEELKWIAEKLVGSLENLLAGK